MKIVQNNHGTFDVLNAMRQIIFTGNYNDCNRFIMSNVFFPFQQSSFTQAVGCSSCTSYNKPLSFQQLFSRRLF